ncbi:MAG: DUF72 domain-containing protein [Actinobacteria bacterium]|nr:DUF72 domain-containing protein [Actinomycetota bacterium]
MWAQRAWVGRFLPYGTPSGRELHPYSRLVNAVEGNTTFYALPPATTVAKWAELAHPDFRFVFKVPRTITHDQRLIDVDDELAAFVALMAPLGELIGGFTLQLPPSFGPRDLGALARVLAGVPTDWRWSVEVRHPDFYGGPGRRSLEALLRRHGAEWVLLDTIQLFHRTPYTDEGRDEWRTKPRVPLMIEPLTDQPIVRFIGSDHPELTDLGLHRWQPLIADWLDEGRTPTMFVHTPDNERTPELARGFHDAVARLVPQLTPLPEALPVGGPEQISLF